MQTEAIKAICLAAVLITAVVCFTVAFIKRGF